MSFANRPVQKTDTSYYIPADLVLGNFALTTTEQGAVVVKPPLSSPETAPSFIAKPVSLTRDSSGIYITDAEVTGGRIAFREMLNTILDIEISVDGLEMSTTIRSLFGSLLSRAGAVEAAVADISGSRLPVITAANAVLEANQIAQDLRIQAEEAGSLSQAIKDAQQDAEAALNALNDSAAAATVSALSAAIVDLSGNIRGRVEALENAPAYDPTAITAAVADLSGNYYGYKGTNDAAVAGHEGRIAAVEAVGADGRIAALEASVPSKVAQADYDVAIAALTAGVAAKLDATEHNTYVAANDAAVAAKAEATAVEAKGYLTKVETELVDFSGISTEYWAGPWASIKAAALAGKLVEVKYTDGPVTVWSDIGAGAAGQVVRFRNVGAAHPFTVEFGLPGALIAEVEIQPGETVALVSNGTTWRLI